MIYTNWPLIRHNLFFKFSIVLLTPFYDLSIEGYTSKVILPCMASMKKAMVGHKVKPVSDEAVSDYGVTALNTT